MYRECELPVMNLAMQRAHMRCAEGTHKLGLGQALPSPSMIRICSLPAHSLLRRHAVKRFSQKGTQKADGVHWEDVPSDPRPPWVYSTSAGLRLILIPSE